MSKIINLPLYMEMNIGQGIKFKLLEGVEKRVELSDIDTSSLTVKVEGEKVKMPIGELIKVKEVMVGAEVNKFYSGLNRYSDAHLSIKTDARLFLHDASLPLSPANKYTFPLMGTEYEYFKEHWLSKVIYGYHVGIDLYCPDGSNIVSVCKGKVIAVREYNSGVDEEDYWGKFLSILGEDKLVYYYFHFQEMKVSLGQEIQKGQIIGTSGRSGFETKEIRSHLHFQIWKLRSGKEAANLGPFDPNFTLLHTKQAEGFVINPYHYLVEWDPVRKER